MNQQHSDFQEQFVAGGKQVAEHFRILSDHTHCDSAQHSQENQLQHIRFQKRFQEIGGNDPHDHILYGDIQLLGRNRFPCSGQDCRGGAARLEKVKGTHTNCRSDHGGYQIQADHSAADIAALMTGHEVYLPTNQSKKKPGEPMLEVHNLFVRGDRGNMVLNKLNLTVRAGEIVGLAGVSGNGQRELAEALTGLRTIDSGDVMLDGVSLVGKTPKQIIAQGMGYVPEERNVEGIVPSMSIRENLVLKDIAKAPFSKAGVLINNKKIDENADAMREKFDIRCSSVNVAAGSLSGGNIQKVILAREINRGPKFLIAVYPIRGLDLGAAEFIHKQLLALRDSGVGILLISEELEEVINLSDRIAVIFKGQIQRTLGQGEATQRKLGMMMAGVKEI